MKRSRALAFGAGLLAVCGIVALGLRSLAADRSVRSQVAALPATELSRPWALRPPRSTADPSADRTFALARELVGPISATIDDPELPTHVRMRDTAPSTWRFEELLIHAEDERFVAAWTLLARVRYGEDSKLEPFLGALRATCVAHPSEWLARLASIDLRHDEIETSSAWARRAVEGPSLEPLSPLPTWMPRGSRMKFAHSSAVGTISDGRGRACACAIVFSLPIPPGPWPSSSSRDGGAKGSFLSCSEPTSCRWRARSRPLRARSRRVAHRGRSSRARRGGRGRGPLG